MKARGACIGLITCAAIVAGCGGGDDAGEGAAAPKKQTLAQRHAEIERDPYELRCGDMKDKLASADITRIVQVALANDAKIAGLTQLQAGQSIFFAMTELCKDKPASYQPARAAIAGVRSGEWRADLGTP